MTNLTKDTLEQFLKDNPKAVIDLWAPWCGPCRMLGPVLEEVCDGKNSEFVLGKVNVDDEQEIARQFNCMSIPMVLKFENGVLKDQFVGYRGKGQVEEFLK